MSKLVIKLKLTWKGDYATFLRLGPQVTVGKLLRLERQEDEVSQEIPNCLTDGVAGRHPGNIFSLINFVCIY